MPEAQTAIVLVKGRADVPRDAAKPGRGYLRLTGDLEKRIGKTVPARAFERGDRLRLDTAIARHAPPGRHKATLVIDETETPVTIEVAERRKLRFYPSAVRITGRPGDKAVAEVSVANLGNVPLDVPTGGISGLFASDGLAGAFAGAYAVDSEDHQEIFGAFIHGLRRGYLGLMKVGFEGEADAGQLQPGESRTLKASFVIPQSTDKNQIGAGRRFHATFNFDVGRLVARLTLSAPPKPRRGATS